MTIDELKSKLSGLEGEERKATIDAIKKILASRLGTGKGDIEGPEEGPISGPIGPIEVEIDPDLLEPSSKSDGDTPDDIDIDDPDHVLDDLKQNESEDDDDFKDKDDKKSKDPKGDGEGKKDKTEDEKDEEKKKSGSSDEKDKDDPEIEGDSPDFKDIKAEEEEAQKVTERKADKSRCERLAERTLEWGKERGADPEALKDLENKLNKVKELTEDDLKEMSRDEYESILDEVIEACNKIREVSYTPDLDTRISQIQQDLDSGEMAAEIAGEERRHVEPLKARHGEAKKYSMESGGSMPDFELSFKQGLKDQIDQAMKKQYSYTRLNRRNSETGTISPGYKIIPDKDKPSVVAYVDQSGSWGDADLNRARAALGCVADLERKKQIKLDILYFSNALFKDAGEARRAAKHDWGLYEPWDDILANIQNSHTKNVVIFADQDMAGKALHSRAIHVPGCVWFVWKSKNYKCPEVAAKIIGDKDNFHFYLY